MRRVRCNQTGTCVVAVAGFGGGGRLLARPHGGCRVNGVARRAGTGRAVFVAGFGQLGVAAAAEGMESCLGRGPQVRAGGAAVTVQAASGTCFVCEVVMTEHTADRGVLFVREADR